MTTFRIAVCLCVALTTVRVDAQASPGNLEAFPSQAEFDAWLRSTLRKTRRENGLLTRDQAMRCMETAQPQRRAAGGMMGTLDGESAGAAGLGIGSGQGYGAGAASDGTMEMIAPSPSVMSPAPPSTAPAAAPSESITNTQEANVDEGAIVKVHGNHLVVLRRGRIFTISTANGDLSAVDAINAFAPGSRVSEDGAWYDEMLVHGDTVVVIGFRYQETSWGDGQGATEVGLFNIAGNGRLTHRRTFYLRSNDYYSSRNYASRLVGEKLIFYMPYPLLVERYSRCGMGYLSSTVPASSERFRVNGWNSVLQATQVYRPATPIDWPTLHTVVTCDLGSASTPCRAAGVVGGEGRTFYVSGNAVYIWTDRPDEPGTETEPGAAVVYRLPLEGRGAGALPVFGMPTDQFSFREGQERLDVLVRSESGGDRMWGAEVTAGDVALAQIPLRHFGLSPAEVLRLGASAAEGARVQRGMFVTYQRLARPTDGDAFQNRFVGEHVLYGSGTSWGTPQDYANQPVFVHSLRDRTTAQVRIGHGVDRIDLLGTDAIVIGASSSNLHFTAIDLSGRPAVLGAYVRRDASQGELRSQGFFYKPTGAGTGVVGLPIRGAGRPGYEHLAEDSASVLFLSVNRGQFQELGNLGAGQAPLADDHCVASCVDWYGNARPIFFQNRIFALLGYELVEGSLAGWRLGEKRRVNFATVIDPPRRRGGTVVVTD